MNEQRKNVMVGTAGHVDHGKTALVKLLTGCDTDTLAEEKQRGMTIDLGFTSCRLTGDRIVGVVDVPGHADFIRNMVAGAHGIDIVMLVVAADDGIMPQTREHLHILTLMGLKHGLVALTKIDLVEPARREEVTRDVRSLLADTFLANAPICPISTITGEGYDLFYDTLNQAVNGCEARSCSGIFHLWVEDVFTIRGAGTVITGIPTNGRVCLGDHLALAPSGQNGRVRRLQVYGDDATEGRAGECTALNLAEVDHQQIRRGMVLTEIGAANPVEIMDVELRLLPGFRRALKDQAEVHLHIGTAAVMARVALLEKPQLTPGESQFAQLRLSEPLGVFPGERFAIRAQDTDVTGLSTIGGGRVVGISNTRLRRNKPWVIAALAARRDALDDPCNWCEVILKQAGKPLTLKEWAELALVHEAELQTHLTVLQSTGRVVAVGLDTWTHHETLGQVVNKILEHLQRFHQENPQSLGIAPADFPAVVATDKVLTETALKKLCQEKRVVVSGTVLALAGRAAPVVSEEHQLATRVAQTLKQAAWTPPTPLEISLQVGQPLKKITLCLQRLKESGEAVLVAPDMFLHREALAAAKTTILKLFARASSFTTMDFRDALGVSRKFAVPLLDYLDTQRFTVRNGNLRTPGVEVKKLSAVQSGK